VKRLDFETFKTIFFDNSVLTIGNFDGLHRGHQFLIEDLLKTSQKYKSPSVVISFSPHPKAYFNSWGLKSPLFSKEDLMERLNLFGVDYYVEIPFNKSLSETAPLEFYKNYLIKWFKPKAIRIGYDFCFGKDRSGDSGFLNELCIKDFIDFKVIPAFQLNDKVVSSSQIREFLEQGNILMANSFLGRNYYLTGTVKQGNKLARSWGLPTANIYLNEQTALCFGVYLTYTEVNGTFFKSISNIGKRPTVSSDSQTVLETHILKESIELYNKKIKVYFCEYLRNEIKFSNLDNLKMQIQLDVKLAQEKNYSFPIK
jgi:riboflavin kinase/FMN adenylyltransferase